jgi:hypothetical protein
MTAVATPAPVRVFLDWRRGQVGPLAPCVLCGQLALCRSPRTGQPCHKGCAEAWIAAHACDQVGLARLIEQVTPAGGRSLWH